jgi:hypothetical protein
MTATCTRYSTNDSHTLSKISSTSIVHISISLKCTPFVVNGLYLLAKITNNVAFSRSHKAMFLLRQKI